MAEVGLTVSTTLGQHIRVQSVLTVGRDGQPFVDGSQRLALSDPAVSRNHALLVWDGYAAWVRDLGSMTGTRLVYGARTVQIVPGTCHALTDGDIVEIGRERLVVAITAPDRSSARRPQVVDAR